MPSRSRDTSSAVGDLRQLPMAADADDSRRRTESILDGSGGGASLMERPPTTRPKKDNPGFTDPQARDRLLAAWPEDGADDAEEAPRRPLTLSRRT